MPIIKLDFLFHAESESSVHILDTRPLSARRLARISSILYLVFASSIVPFAEQQFLTLMKFHFLIFFFYGLCLRCHTEESSTKPYAPKSFSYVVF